VTGAWRRGWRWGAGCVSGGCWWWLVSVVGRGELFGARVRAAVIVAVAGGCLMVVGRRRVSAGGGWERFEARERGDELVGPGPGAL
jgi:hypothetical protein